MPRSKKIGSLVRALGASRSSVRPPGVAIGSAIAAATMVLAAASAHAADDDQIKRGEYLAIAGDCVACHSVPGGQPYAGGEAIDTPFGRIYPPNITPDKASGIGSWTKDQFWKTIHDGLGKDGEYLYPAMPYPWTTKVSRADSDAIKDYLDSIPAVQRKTPKDTMMFPFNVRTGIAGWNAAFFHEGVFKPDPSKSDKLNRGAYLVEGLAHCSDCHTPKGLAMEPNNSEGYAGGMIDNWYAPNITSDPKRGIGAWSEDDLVTYLKTGTAPGKGIAVGPMGQVVSESMSHMTDEDLHAIAAYVKTIPPISSYNEAKPSGLQGPTATGADTYLSNCSFCHQQDGNGIPGAIPALNGNGAVTAKGPQDVIRVILGGLVAHDQYALMPAVGADMTDQQIADVTSYVRTQWSNGAPASTGGGMVAELRKETNTMLDFKAPDACSADDAKTIKALPDPDGRIGDILAGTDEGNMSQRVDQIVARITQTVQGRSHAEIVNGLTLAYCPVLAHSDRSAAQRRSALSRLAQLVYTELVSGEKNH